MWEYSDHLVDVIDIQASVEMGTGKSGIMPPAFSGGAEVLPHPFFPLLAPLCSVLCPAVRDMAAALSAILAQPSPGWYHVLMNVPVCTSAKL